MNILFQGDSITDAGRMRDVPCPNHGLGQGYATMVAGRLSIGRQDLNFYNRGVSGNRIADLYGRWQEDALNINFDVLSILMGINDVGFHLRLGKGSDKERFRFIYDRIIYEALEKNPDTKLILLEPFIVKLNFDWPPYGNDIYETYDMWAYLTREKAVVVSELAKKYSAVFVPLFDLFINAADAQGASRVVIDGVHPTAIGHGIIASEWIKAWNTLGL